MRRRALLALAAPATALGQPARAPAQAPPDPGAIQRVEAYFNAMTTFRARFLQIAQNGGSAEGTAMIWRPGRMRFEYDAPEPTLLIAADGQFFHWDRELRQPTTVPVGSTPLGVLLRQPLSLRGDVTVAGTERSGGLLRMAVFRTAAPNEGRITLILEENPMQLRQWEVLDAQGRTTRVTLTQIETGVRFDPFLFAFNDPRFREELDRAR
ncbi:MAG: outer membrane lipoprotein carrier protein LolA [Rubritepida sp.]|nr:outer membrane lipoprotein carrier protein LolA [Rubritepida sp.]